MTYRHKSLKDTRIIPKTVNEIQEYLKSNLIKTIIYYELPY
ncbi:hypothetical protein LCGC14_1510890 [marine sediment metagenome]|uniref:Uncharacterized protein n=1 Tax=marine sediment metagenome TaxID=412755 RepID=A0A0F9J1Q2_9ZZZZ